MTDDNLQKIVQGELQKIFSSFITKFWYIITGMVIASAAAWYSLYYQVQNLEQNALEKNTQIQRDIDLLRNTYLRDIQDIKNDIRFIRESI